MNNVILKFSFRESAVWSIPIVLTILGYVLLGPTPLRFYDGVLAILGAALGGVLGFRIFFDGGGVRPFLFSRPFSPTRLFMVRWLYGMSIIVGTWLIVALMIAGGLRQTLQVVLFNNGWYPMVRFSELESLWTLVICSLYVYQATVFFTVRNRFLGKRKFGKIAFAFRTALTVVLVIYSLIIGFFAILFAGIEIGYAPGLFRPLLPFLVLMFGLPAALLTLCVPFCGRYCYRNQEIES